MKKLGIITINFNNAQGLKKTLDSIAMQSYREFDLVVIDGGSNDGSVELLQQFSKIITCSVSEKDAGIYDAQNKGIANSTAEYLLFLNSGDVLADNTVLQEVVKQLDADIVYGNMLIAVGDTLRIGLMPDVIDLRQMMLDTLWHPVSFIKRTLFQTYGYYDTNYKFVADYDFFFKVIIHHNVRTKHLPLTIAIFSSDGTSSNPNNHAAIKQEKEKVWAQYLSKNEIENFWQQEHIRYQQQQKQSRWFRRWFRNWFQS